MPKGAYSTDEVRVLDTVLVKVIQMQRVDARDAIFADPIRFILLDSLHKDKPDEEVEAVFAKWERDKKK
jgi:hypothetical protein